MADKPFSLVQGEVMRLTRVDNCGTPIPGACGTIVTDGFVSVGMTRESDEGEEFQATKANGRKCIDQRARPRLRWFNVEINFCVADPEAIEMMTGSQLWEDFAGTDSIGWVDDDDTHDDANFALEVWSNVAGATACGGDAECGPDADEQWGYLLLPLVTNGMMSDTTVENGPLSWVITGQTRANANWGDGPYNVQTGTDVVTDGVTTITDPTVTSATAAFTAADVGSTITGAGIPALATILSINSPTSVEISANATATATGVTLTIGGRPDGLTASFPAKGHRLVTLTNIAPPDPEDTCGCIELAA